MLRFRSVLKFAMLGGGCAGGVIYLHKHRWNPSNTGIVRVGRAAFAASLIAFDYKYNLRGLSGDDETYTSVIKEIHQRSATRLMEMCAKNGGVFIKVGQHVGALEYLLPIEYVRTFKVFHSDAPASPLSDIFYVMKKDFGVEPDTIFEEFEAEPIGAASLAQVHKAKLRDTGEMVAVKVQHRYVKGHSFIDLKSMEFLVNVIARIFPGFKFKWLVEETKRNLPKELDFVHEATNAERVEMLFRRFDFLKVPKIYWKYTTSNVLTMEFCEGGKVNDLAYMKKHNISTKQVIHCLSQLYSDMIFVKGYVHSDPHPGNVLVRQNGNNGALQLILLDHGLYASLTDSFRVNYSHLWLSLIKGDVEGIRATSEQLGIGNLYPLLACMLTARSWDAVTSSGIDTKKTQSENEEIALQASEYVLEITQVLNSVPRQMILIFKTNDLLRGLEYTLNLPHTSMSLINMSRCCVKAVYTQKLRHSKRVVSRMWIQLAKELLLLKINLYELFLLVKSYFSVLHV